MGFLYIRSCTLNANNLNHISASITTNGLLQLIFIRHCGRQTVYKLPGNGWELSIGVAFDIVHQNV